ncbi:MAG: DUF2092 domain-containing protein [Phycisphaerae bacterium]|nr:DUF2092 domain-containing protein [Phycisphaerae bacterium]
MITGIRNVVFYIGLLSLLALPVRAQEPAVAAQPASAPAESAFDAKASARVSEMSAFLAKQQKFRFEVEIMYDAVEEDGHKLQIGRRSRVEVMRPGSLHVDSQGDRGWDQAITFDGRHFLLHDRSKKVFSRVDVAGTLDDLFKFVFEKFGTAPPLADFLGSDVNAALMTGAKSCQDLGDAFVAEKECDHIAFTGESLDWQLWIEKGATPWPRKFVITYKDPEVRPQFIAIFRTWEANVALDAARFNTAAPAGAAEAPLTASSQPAPEEK